MTTSRTADDPANVTVPEESACCSSDSVDAPDADSASKTISNSTTTLPAPMPTMTIWVGRQPAAAAVSALNDVSNDDRSGLPAKPMSSCPRRTV